MTTFSQVLAFTTRERPARPSVLQAVARMLRARHTRRLLAEMDDRMLSDIGIGRGDALMEARRAPWDV